VLSGAASRVIDPTATQLAALGTHLAARREVILQAWRKAARNDPVQTTVASLTRTQFNDHIPTLLDAFERKLRALPGSINAAAADATKTLADEKHGLQRWQQGYHLQELMHEWGHLQKCLAAEIAGFALSHPEVERETVIAAHAHLGDLVTEGINISVGEYARLQQAEAAGHVRDLQQALIKVSEIERRRVDMIRQAVHDLRTNVQSVSSAAEVLKDEQIAEDDRIAFTNLVQQGVDSVSSMLEELMALARLEAGQDKRVIAPMDAAHLLIDSCRRMQPIAAEHKLFITAEGPDSLPVEGDASKLRRIVQNLLSNALKYTVRGGVTLSWGVEKESWWVITKDTGPGILAGPSAPMAAGIAEATVSAREADVQAARVSGEKPTVLASPTGPIVSASPHSRQQGEGIGLSIVKRLCELLDASLELASSAETGTTFRVVLPRSYPERAA
jgi:signal transduction histidine kinase